MPSLSAPESARAIHRNAPDRRIFTSLRGRRRRPIKRRSARSVRPHRYPLPAESCGTRRGFSRSGTRASRYGIPFRTTTNQRNKLGSFRCDDDPESACSVRCALGGAGGLTRSAVKHRPADVVPQPLVVKYKLANRLRELVTLPPALESACGLALALRRGSTCGLDRVGGRTELVHGDMRDGPGLAGSVGGMR